MSSQPPPNETGTRSSLQYAQSLDSADPLRHLREEFIIPSKADIKRRTATKDAATKNDEAEPCTYLCGNSLGLQPKRVSEYVQRYLRVWGSKGVFGHFTELEDQLTSPWLDIGDDPKVPLSKIVGAQSSEVAVMASLTANLHLLMASFYRPTKERYKIILERKAFPSDHACYAVESQILHHNLSIDDAMIFLDPTESRNHYLPTSQILSLIDAHASSTALLLLPGVQFYSGQFFDIPTITSYAQARGITVGWDLAHATGNVPLKLHDWNVDFAAWCHYKYMNAGPGAIAGLFVHSRHGSKTDPTAADFVPRLAGWWGSDKSSRFRMENRFVPIEGAAGWQLSNPSAIDATAVIASLSVFEMTSIEALRERSLKLTGYLEDLLNSLSWDGRSKPFEIITPKNAGERGAQLSVHLEDGLLEPVLEYLEEECAVVDERRPSVIRVAPAPLYNSFEDVWRFVQIFHAACGKAVAQTSRSGKEQVVASSVLAEGGKDSHGWSEIK
ncbi:kynureninase 1 [Rhizodiscina lignyota]|uniref:Kynureninase n=1 Tax=Rhizodiscina lignyota TaxID=1504668 RepID=A0A9P4I358_9PEZI|nr:kynureninase 1 [Rhizodiscina lignyota]